MLNVVRTLLSFALFFLGCSTIYAGQFETSDHLKSIAKEFVTKTIVLAPDETLEVNVSEPNAGLHLSACTKEIKANLPKEANKELITAVELSCDGNEPWQITLPIDMQIFTNVLVAKQTIPAKNALTEEDLDYASVNKNRLFSGYFKNKNEVIGLIAFHSLIPGTVLNKKNLVLPAIVHKNQTVTLVSIRGSVSVSMQGISRSDGALNSMIKVFNPSSKRTVNAVITGPNQAQTIG